MLSIEKCNEILNKKGKKYTKEEVIAIRGYLYQMAMVIDKLKSKDNE